MSLLLHFTCPSIILKCTKTVNGILWDIYEGGFPFFLPQCSVAPSRGQQGKQLLMGLVRIWLCKGNRSENAYGLWIHGNNRSITHLSSKDSSGSSVLGFKNRRTANLTRYKMVRYLVPHRPLLHYDPGKSFLGCIGFFFIVVPLGKLITQGQLLY